MQYRFLKSLSVLHQNSFLGGCVWSSNVHKCYSKLCIIALQMVAVNKQNYRQMQYIIVESLTTTTYNKDRGR